MSPVNLVVAFHKEARPIIDAFDLKRAPDHQAIFENETMTLMISGLGKTLAAMAVGYLAARRSVETSAWINVGICGHRDRRLGETLLVHKINDADTGQTWFPGRVWVGDLPSDNLVTVSAPLTSDYPMATCIDMEGAGFYQAASRFTSSERIQLLKVVSDNEENPPNRKTHETAADLVSEALPTLRTLLARISGAAHSDAYHLQRTHELVQKLAQLTVFSVTETHQLRAELGRWHALHDTPFPLERFGTLPAAELIASLRSECERTALTTEL